jgi:photosystem II stability/assembly factor-like uncharacterized protein
MVDDIYPENHDNGTPTISLNKSLLLWDQTAQLTVNFPEPVNAFSQGTNTCSTAGSGTSNLSTAASFNMDNATGSLSSLSASSCLGTSWTATFTPTNDVEVLSNTITLSDNWTDQVGNPGLTAVTSSYEVETYRPRAAISFTSAQGFSYDSKDAFRPGDNGTITVVFTEITPDPIVVNFSSSDITAPYLELSTMTSSDNITYTTTFTPVDNSTGGSHQSGSYTPRLTLPYNSYNDIKGNSGYSTVYSTYYVVDTKAPSVDHVILEDRLDTPMDDTFTKSDGTYRCIPVDSEIKVVFDYIMDTTKNTISTNDADTYCRSETLKVSSDNFSTGTSGSCVKFASPPAAAGHDSGVTNQKFTLDPVDNLSAYTTYQVRVEPEVEDVLENTMTSQYTHSNAFRTSAFSSTTPTSGVFVAVGQYASSFRSIDNGTSWENETCSFFTTSNLLGITYANNTFVAVGNNGKIVKSTDNASSWQVSTSSPSSQLNGITFGGSTFDVVGSDGNTYYSSNTGSSWTYRRAPSSGSPYYSHKSLYGVAFGNSTFVGVGSYGKIVRSADGASWSNVTTGSSPYTYGSNHLRGVTFGNNTFVAVGYTGKIIRSTNEGSSWDNVTKVNNNNLYGVTFGNGTFVAVGQSGTIIKSTDNGASWSSSSSGGNTLNGVTFGNNIFMAVGEDGRIVKSTDDGSNWSSSSSGTTNDLKGVTFGD